MRRILKAGALPALALMTLGAMSPAKADDAPANGVPEESIAQGWNDPVRAAFAQRGVLYGLNYTGEYYNVTSGGISRGSTYNGLIETYVDIDLQKLLGWKGAAIHANAYYVHGIGRRPIPAVYSPSAISKVSKLFASMSCGLSSRFSTTS